VEEPESGGLSPLRRTSHVVPWAERRSPHLNRREARLIITTWIRLDASHPPAGGKCLHDASPPSFN